MKIKQRAFSGAADQQMMMALGYAFPADNLHGVDQPYRFSSWAFDDPANAQLWTDEQGRILAWVVLQTPFWAIDYACHPEFADEVHPQLLAWADQRARQLVGSDFGRPIWFVNVFTNQLARIRDLAAAGFASQANVGENSWSKVLMQQRGMGAATSPMTPGKFVIRPLAGMSEVAAYVDLHQTVFESRSMTVAWRARTLQQPAYRPALDLVAVADDGRLAAFCLCWLDAGAYGIRGQVEPMGVYPDFRGFGVGRAILSEGLRRLYEQGAQEILVETDNFRNAAFALYESVGFRVMHDVLVFRKDYAV
ncbi:MAG: GNAT family N-acetyltransferase [Chloroflexi bacterium]|nr:GNAT family N-acetyltransferase [Chloroflexota bacterium]